MGHTIYAIFDDFATAQRIATALERDGYDPSRMSVIAPRPAGVFGEPARKSEAEGLIDGPAAGARGTLEDIEVAGLGTVAAAGPLLESVSSTSRDPKGLIQSLSRLGFSDPAARHYYESLRRRQVLVAVEVPDHRARQVESVMRRFGARAVEDIVSTPVAGVATEPIPAAEGFVDQVTVPVVEEQLDVGKRQVSRGGIRINSQIVEQPIQEQIQLREERVSVERRQVNREATEADMAAFKDGSIEIHETVEEPVITKRRRVVEEVVVGRETRERTQSITETLRKTQVNVEQLGPVDPGNGATSHGQATAGERVDNSELAYRYGSNLARDERYRHADWSEIEPHARRTWEDENEGTWEQFKDAIRTAWDKVSRH